MAMAIYMDNENDPNGSTSSETHPNTCRTEEKKFFLKKNIFRSHALCGTRV